MADNRHVSPLAAAGGYDIPRIIIYGSGGYSLMVAHDLRHGRRSRPLCEVVAYIDDFAGGKGLDHDGAPIILFDEWREKFLDLPVFVGVAGPKAKRLLAERVTAAGGRFARLFDSPDVAFPFVSMGDGAGVSGYSGIGSHTSLGAHVQIMPMCWIGHHVTIKDYVTVTPSCTILGNVIIEEEVFIGAGAVIVDGKPERPLVVGAGAKIAAGAVVTKSLAPGATVAGNPARPLRDIARSRIVPRGAK